MEEPQEVTLDTEATETSEASVESPVDTEPKEDKRTSTWVEVDFGSDWGRKRRQSTFLADMKKKQSGKEEVSSEPKVARKAALTLSFAEFKQRRAEMAQKLQEDTKAR